MSYYSLEEKRIYGINKSLNSVGYYCKCSSNEAYNLLYGQCVGV